MKVKKLKHGYRCPDCSEIHAGKPEVVKAWLCEEVNDQDITELEPQKICAARMPCCEDLFNEEDVETFDELWMCGECGVVYEDKDEAKECCQ